MIIGIDFDNTIIDYDNLFHTVGLSLGVLPETISGEKSKIREYLVQQDQEHDWIKIQGLVYGKYIHEAQIMKGFTTFLDLCQRKDWRIVIVSHKTRDSIAGERFNLHDSALRWLEENGIFGSSIHSAVGEVFFELTRAEKIHRINQIGCTIMIDDLIDVLIHPDLSKSIVKILYDPRQTYTPPGDIIPATNWNQISRLMMRMYE